MIDIPIELKLENIELSSPPISYSKPSTFATNRNSFVDPVSNLLPFNLLATINSLYTLNDNWDFNDAVAPDAEAIKNCTHLLNLMPQKALNYLTKDSISITPYGTITIEWQQEGRLLSLEIGNEEFGFFGHIYPNEDFCFDSLNLEKKDELPKEISTKLADFLN